MSELDFEEIEKIKKSIHDAILNYKSGIEVFSALCCLTTELYVSKCEDATKERFLEIMKIYYENVEKWMMENKYDKGSFDNKMC